MLEETRPEPFLQTEVQFTQEFSDTKKMNL